MYLIAPGLRRSQPMFTATKIHYLNPGTIMKQESDTNELNILRIFFEKACSENKMHNWIDGSKLVKDTQRQLREILRGTKHKCTCHRCLYTICETCQESGSDLVTLRNFFREIRNANKNSLTDVQIQEFIRNTKDQLG